LGWVTPGGIGAMEGAVALGNNGPPPVVRGRYAACFHGSIPDPCLDQSI